jgi:hypothetical protein
MWAAQAFEPRSQPARDRSALALAPQEVDFQLVEQLWARPAWR